MFVKQTIIMFAALIALALPAVATAANPELGPVVGTAIPHQLNVNSQPEFTELSGEKGAALFFVRSIKWCPFCKNQVINISSNVEEFEKRGLKVIFLSYDSQEEQDKFKENKSLNVSFVSDEDSTIIDAFGLRNENYQEGSFAYGVPYPAVFLITPEGTIKGKLYEEEYLTDTKSYKNRPAVTIILEKADEVLGL